MTLLVWELVVRGNDGTFLSKNPITKEMLCNKRVVFSNI